MPEKKVENIDLEAAMKRLDKITEELSREGIGLEESLALYEEGVKLVRLCNKKLDETERRIKILRMSADGEMTEQDLDAPAQDA